MKSPIIDIKSTTIEVFLTSKSTMRVIKDLI